MAYTHGHCGLAACTGASNCLWGRWRFLILKVCLHRWCTSPSFNIPYHMQETFAQALSQVKEQHFPGGTFKYSNIKNFPGSDTMSASLIRLEEGGIRGLHWHDEAEWAYVLSGTCR